MLEQRIEQNMIIPANETPSLVLINSYLRRTYNNIMKKSKYNFSLHIYKKPQKKGLKKNYKKLNLFLLIIFHYISLYPCLNAVPEI